MCSLRGEGARGITHLLWGLPFCKPLTVGSLRIRHTSKVMRSSLEIVLLSHMANGMSCTGCSDMLRHKLTIAHRPFMSSDDSSGAINGVCPNTCSSTVVSTTCQERVYPSVQGPAAALSTFFPPPGMCMHENTTHMASTPNGQEDGRRGARQAPTVPKKNLLCRGMLWHASSRRWGVPKFSKS